MPRIWLTHDGETPKIHATEPSTALGSWDLVYQDEGGANVIFAFRPLQERQELPEPLVGRLLRLRKDLPGSMTTEQQLDAFRTHFEPLFPPENIIQHELIALDTEVIKVLNRHLNEIERPPARKDTRLDPSELFGLLITDMTPSTDEVLLQFKPKWLAQSPNAPSDSKRCRTCALRAHRMAVSAATATDEQHYCPLALCGTSLKFRMRAAEAITTAASRSYIINELQGLLTLLRRLQADLDPRGVLEISSTSDRAFGLCKAMTLRDCTVYILERSDRSVECRIGDLDMKQMSKVERWRQTEMLLISEGWYTNTESPGIWVREQTCLLARQEGLF